MAEERTDIMRELSLRLLLSFLICIVFGSIFTYIASAISNETIVDFDSPIISFVQGLESDGLTTIMKTFTTIGSTPFVILFTLAGMGILLYKRHRAQAFLLFVAIAGSGLLNIILKTIYKRARPELHRIVDIGGFSFPSGHTMLAFSLYAVLAFIVWRNLKTTVSRIVLFLFAVFMILMIGVSRIYLGVHYPSDVTAGIFASALWMTIATTVYTWYQERKEKKHSTKV
jgi:undecaprenyl-diphosphatase